MNSVVPGQVQEELGTRYRLTAEEKVFEYTNEQIVTALSSILGMRTEAAKVLFIDMLKFLSFVPSRVKLWTPMRIKIALQIFILHTEHYRTFCQTYFNRFIEYDPERGLLVEGQRMDEKQTIELVRDKYPTLSANWE